MSVECTVCYVSDLNFLLPTLVSAAGLRKFVPRHKADIYLFLVDQDIQRLEALNAFLKIYEIYVLPLDSRSFDGFDADKLNRTHVPVAALGRFFIEGLLPPACKRIVYIDGDTWMRRDPSPLIDAVVPDGRFAAAEDIMVDSAATLAPKVEKPAPHQIRRAWSGNMTSSIRREAMRRTAGGPAFALAQAWASEGRALVLTRNATPPPI